MSIKVTPKVMLAALLIAATTTLYGGYVPHSASSKQYTVAIANAGSAFPFPAAEAKGIQDEAKKLGVKVVANLDGRSDPQKQASDVQDLIALKPDGILLMPVNAAESARLVDQIDAAGIPVISVHGQVGANRPLSDVYPKLTALIIENEVGAGGLAAQLALKALPHGGTVAIIEGQAGFAEVGLREKDFKRILAAKGGFQIVATQPADWLAEKGQAACQNILAAHPKIDLFYSESDDMGVGCAKAVTLQHSTAKVIGVGGSKLGISAIRAGIEYGTICYKPYTEGQQAMDEMYKQLTGKTHDHHKLIYYTTPAITKANVNSCIPQW